jgi:hypothetical protein
MNIYFDWDTGVWMTVDKDGNHKEWDGVSSDANEISSDDYPILSAGIKTQTEHGCAHEWAIYDSGFTMFEYCKKCNVKRNEG